MELAAFGSVAMGSRLSIVFAQHRNVACGRLPKELGPRLLLETDQQLERDRELVIN